MFRTVNTADIMETVAAALFGPSGRGYREQQRRVTAITLQTKDIKIRTHKPPEVYQSSKHSIHRCREFRICVAVEMQELIKLESQLKLWWKLSCSTI